jgi:Astacin (Peptidase family M12A)
MLNSGNRDDRPRIARKFGGLFIALGMMAPPYAPARQDDPLTGTGSGQATERPKTKHKITIKAEIEIESIPADAAKTAERPTTRSLITPKPGLPRDTSKLHLGIVKRPGLFAAKEIFYEDRDGLAVVQGDMVVGKVATLQKNLIDEMARLARFVANSSASSDLTEDEKKAVAAVQGLGVSTRSISRAANHPDVQELIDAAARLPLDALNLDPRVLAELQRLLETPYGRRILGQISTVELGHVREQLKQDATAREQVKAGLAELANRAGVQFPTTRSLKEDPVARSIATIRSLAPAPATSKDLQRLRSLASLAPDSLGLNPEQTESLKILGKNAPASAKTVTGEPYLIPPTPSEASTRAFFVSDRSLYWDNGVLPYVFADGFSEDAKQMIKDKVMKDYTDKTSITFKEQAGEADYVKFQITGSNLTHGLGRGDGGELLIELENPPRIGATIHEIGHALGFQHEQARPDRDQFITVLLDKVDSKMRDQFNAIGIKSRTRGPYDFSSIMHYPQDAFGAPPGTITMTQKGGAPLPPSTGDLGANSFLSPLDVNALGIMYGFKP